MSHVPAISEAQEHSYQNRKSLVPGRRAACYHCLQQFPAEEVSDFTDEGATALCPYCGMDTVLTEDMGYALDVPSLQILRAFWFGSLEAPHLW